MMSSSLEPDTEILGNRQTTWTAYAHLAHAHVGSQTAQGCSTDATPHTHAIVKAIHHQHRDVSPGAHARHHGASGPRCHARIASRGFDPKYNLVFPFPGQGGDKPKLYFRRYGAPFSASERRFGDAGCTDRAKVAQKSHP